MICRICFVIFAFVDIKQIRSRLVSEPTKLYVVGNGSWSEGYTKSEVWNDQLVCELQTGQVKCQLDLIHCEFLGQYLDMFDKKLKLCAQKMKILIKHIEKLSLFKYLKLKMWKSIGYSIILSCEISKVLVSKTPSYESILNRTEINQN